MKAFRGFTSLRATLVHVETQNLTLSLPKTLVRQLKVIAAQRNTSITALVTQSLEEIADENAKYREATERLLEHMRRVGHGGIPDREHRWTRDELHER